MISPWQRRRQPDDVPTPVAVAVSDFCRRAKAPAPAQQVREALALLTEDEDFRVRALTDGEPETSPLGPFAVVDILRGVTPALAAQRQECGYYDVAQELAQVREEKTPPPAPAPTTPVFALPTPPSEETDAKTGRRKSAKAEAAAVQERIAPKKRTTDADDADTAAPTPATQAPQEEEAPRFLKRELPRPRGRFTRVEAQRLSFFELTRAEGKETLEAAIEATEHRFSLLRTLEHRYNGPRGEMTQVDMENVLRQHGIMETLEARERHNIETAYASQRGAAGRVAWALGLSPSELQRLTHALRMEEVVEALRERFRNEVLATGHLTHRLDLLGRDKYLVDLGIQKRFADALRKELERLAKDALPDATDLHSLANVVGRKHGAPAELVARAFERLNMTDGLRKQLSAQAQSPSN
ncbi:MULTISPECIES: hypothetical protein [unclassified Corallococcus]|uniref:hypothetical protein n=1 Tax=unclassified Corallococcus TaxID=2685029 RepID=UPI001A904896|nr:MULTISPECIES: hypothetical protein [unclassified Corallococcus]MBN9685469.1 hypothetical protein [Corallococcus sp. NCSPR001]WAS83083.1 hypothetical protein O0N60_27625 [Corallococcus sp. NCRR]